MKAFVVNTQQHQKTLLLYIFEIYLFYIINNANICAVYSDFLYPYIYIDSLDNNTSRKLLFKNFPNHYIRKFCHNMTMIGNICWWFNKML